MTIFVKNKETLIFDSFKFRCSIGKKGFTKKKIEGDNKTPVGTFTIENLYYRKNKFKNLDTKLNCIEIKKNMGWCDDPKDKKNYNKLVKLKKNIKCERLYRNDNQYDLLIPINYNRKKIIPGKGSAIFIHLTKNYRSTLGCVALKKSDFLILIKLIKKKEKIKIA